MPRKQLPGRYSPFRASYRGDGSQVVSTPAQLPALSWNKILEEPPPEGRHQVADQSLSTSLVDPRRTEPSPSHPVDRRGPGWSARVAPPGADAAHPGRRARRAGDRSGATLGTRECPAAPVTAEVAGHPPGPGAVLERENVPLLETRPDASSIPTPTQQALRTLEWVHRKENLVGCGPSGFQEGNVFCSRRSGNSPSKKGCTWPGAPWTTSADSSAGTADGFASNAIARIRSANVTNRSSRNGNSRLWQTSTRT